MKVVLKNVVLRFADLFEAREFKAGDGRPRYSAAFLVEHGSDNDKAVKDAITDTMKEAWQDKAAVKTKAFMSQNGQCCYQDGSSKEYDGCDGFMFLSAHRAAKQGAPAIVDRAKQPLDVSGGKPYPGCTVNAVVDVWAQTGENPGIRCSLSAVQYVKSGEPFGNGAATASDLPELDEDIGDDDLI